MPTKILIVLALILLMSNFARAQQGALILNEYNGVSAVNFLEADDEPFEGFDYGALRNLTLAAGANAGRMKGNGGNWLELVVTQDRLDIRGWTLQWTNADINIPPTPENPNPLPENNGTVQFSNNAIWGNLRAGTIVTVIENSTFTPEFSSGTIEGLNISLTDDVSFNPAQNDWWIHVETKEKDPASPYISTPNSKFKTDNDSWALTIRNASGQTVFGPVGEAAPGWGGSGINSLEMGLLNTDPSAAVDGSDFNDRDYSTFGAPNLLDPTDTAAVFADLVPQNFDLLRNWFYRTDRIPGDANLDRIVNALDLEILALNWQATGRDWMTADFDGDGDVDAYDLGLLAQQWQVAIAGEPIGEALTEVGLIPEPASLTVLLLPAMLLRRRGRLA